MKMTIKTFDKYPEPEIKQGECPDCGNVAGQWGYRLVHQFQMSEWFWRCDCGYESERKAKAHDAPTTGVSK